MASPADTIPARIAGLDVFRGWAIVLMIVFHFAFDLSFFRFIDANLARDTFWVYFRYVIVTIFMVSVGISLGIVHATHVRWDRVLRRAVILGAASVVVTVATYIQAPHTWVYFGILHLIFVVSLVGLLFVRHPALALAAAMLIFYGAYDGWLMHVQHQCYLAVRHPLHLPHRTEDLARFVPWFGATLVGIAAHGWGWDRLIFSRGPLAAGNQMNRFLAFLGRHALVIYLIHLPVLFGAVMGVRMAMPLP